MARSKPKSKSPPKAKRKAPAAPKPKRKAPAKPRISAAEKQRRRELLALQREHALALKLRREHDARERELEERNDRDREARIRAERAPAKRRGKKAPGKAVGKKGAALAKLARKPWKGLRKSEKAELRSWRAKKGWRTRTDRENSALAERLSGEHGKEERDRAREDLRSGGTREIARWLRKTKNLSVRETRAMFAFWFYSQ